MDEKLFANLSIIDDQSPNIDNEFLSVMETFLQFSKYLLKCIMANGQEKGLDMNIFKKSVNCSEFTDIIQNKDVSDARNFELRAALKNTNFVSSVWFYTHAVLTYIKSSNSFDERIIALVKSVYDTYTIISKYKDLDSEVIKKEIIMFIVYFVDYIGNINYDILQDQYIRIYSIRSLIYIFTYDAMFRRIILCRIFDKIGSIASGDAYIGNKQFDPNIIECLSNYAMILGVILKDGYNFSKSIRTSSNEKLQDNKKFREILSQLQVDKLPSYLQYILNKCSCYI